jgi:hypothetical protein
MLPLIAQHTLIERMFALNTHCDLHTCPQTAQSKDTRMDNANANHTMWSAPRHLATGTRGHADATYGTRARRAHARRARRTRLQAQPARHCLLCVAAADKQGHQIARTLTGSGGGRTCRLTDGRTSKSIAVARTAAVRE